MQASDFQQIRADPDYIKKYVKERTALYAAAAIGLHLTKQPTSADALYSISDGGDNSNKTTRKESEPALVSPGVRVYASRFVSASATPRGPTSEELIGLTDFPDLSRVAGRTILGPIGSVSPLGGVKYSLKWLSMGTFTNPLTRLCQTMVVNYRLEVNFRQPGDKFREWKLDLPP